MAANKAFNAKSGMQTRNNNAYQHNTSKVTLIGFWGLSMFEQTTRQKQQNSTDLRSRCRQFAISRSKRIQDNPNRDR
jgi:hypothetical protein